MKSNWQKKYKSDVLIAITVALSPFLAYTHLLFSNELKEILLFGIEFSHGFPSNSTFIWYLFKNIIPFTLLVIWFLTIAMRWKYLLLPLLTLYLYNTLDYLFDSFRINNIRLIYDGNAILLIKIIIIASVIGIIFFCDSYYFKRYRRRLLEISIKSILSVNIKNSNNIYSEKLQSLMEKRDKITETSYLKKAYNAKLVLEDRLQMDNCNSKDEVNNNHESLNLMVICVLVVTTLLWFIHNFIPAKEVWDLGIMQVHSHGFINVQIFLWFLIRKLIIIIPMTLWFLSSQQWWKYAILSPIILYSYQFWEATQDINTLDAAGNIKAFPAIFCVVLILIVISKAIKYRVQILMMYEQLTEEIDNLFKNVDLKANNVLYKNVKQIKMLKAEIARESNAKEQLLKLITLRDELLKQLKVNY